jgi:hypothetical protein
MATRNLSASGYWGDDNILSGVTWANLTRGDVIACNGFSLTVDPDVQTPTNILLGIAVTCSIGFKTFFLNNQGTGILRYYGPLSGTMTILASCAFKSRGLYKELFTGDGTAGQTSGTTYTDLGFSVADEPAYIKVVSGSVTTYWCSTSGKTLDKIGVGDLGNRYAYDITTGVLSFGDGGKPKALTSSAAAAQKVVNVSDGSVFAANDWVHMIEYDISGNIVHRETCQISSISTNALTMVSNLDYAYTTSAVCRLSKGGNILPDGAVVYVNNILIGTVDSSGNPTVSTTNTTNYELTTSAGGIIDLQNINFVGFCFVFNSPKSVTMSDVGSIISGEQSNTNTFSATRWFMCGDRYSTTEYRSIYSGNANLINWNVTDSAFIRNSVSNLASSSPTCIFNNVDFIINERGSAGSTVYNVYSDQGYGSTYTSCRFIGATMNLFASNDTLTNCQFSDSPRGTPTGGNQDTSLRAYGKTMAIIDNLSVMADGISSNTSYFLGGFTLIKNSTLLTRTGSIWEPSTGIPSKMMRCKIRNNGAYLLTLSATKKDIILQDVEFTGYDLSELSNTMASNCKLRSVGQKNATYDISTGPAVDTNWANWIRSATTGLVALYFTPKVNSTWYTASADSDLNWSMDGKMYITGNSGWILFESEWMYGVTDYDGAGTIGKSGTNNGNFTYQYQIDVGSGWTDLADLTVANLTAHTIVNGKHRLRIKISRSGGNATGNVTDYIERLTIPTIRDNTILYPEEDTTIAINVIDINTKLPIEGVMVYIVAGAGGDVVAGTVLLEDVTDVNGDVSAYFGWNEDQPITGYTRLGDPANPYDDGSIVGTVLSTGFSTIVQMVKDV